MSSRQNLLSASPETPQLKYKPLANEHSFRLLKLYPGEDRYITCDILEESLDNCNIAYEAISYHWGPYPNADKVHFPNYHDGTYQHACRDITLNLSSILRDLRYSNKVRYLWVDALCINQEDMAERSAQVQRMGEIYRKASRVLFCIGRPTQETELLFKVERELQQYAQSQECETGRPDLNECFVAIMEQLESKYYSLEARLSKALSYILNQEWFYRIWIIQEVVNARDALVCCGTDNMPSAVFSELITVLNHPLSPHCRAIVNMMPSSGQRMEPRTLHSLIMEFGGSKATEPHDKIFALLNLCSDTEKASLRPDYAKSEEMVIRDVLGHVCGCTVADNIPLPWKGIKEFVSAQHGDYDRIYNDTLILLLEAQDASTANSLLQSHGTTIQVTPKLIILAATQSSSFVMKWLEKQTNFDQLITDLQLDQLARATASALENDHEQFLCRLLNLEKWPAVHLEFAPHIKSEKIGRFYQSRPKPTLDPGGLKPLSLAARFNLSGLALAIIQRDGQPDPKDKQQRLEDSPAHIAALFGNCEVLETLLSRGFRVDVSTTEGFDVLDYGLQADRTRILRMLCRLNPSHVRRCRRSRE